MDIQYNQVDQDSFNNRTGDSNNSSVQNDGSEQYHKNTVNTREKNKEIRILKILFFIFTLIIL